MFPSACEYRPKHTSMSWSDIVENIVVYFSQQYILERMNIVSDNTTTITFFFFLHMKISLTQLRFFFSSLLSKSLQ